MSLLLPDANICFKILKTRRCFFEQEMPKADRAENGKDGSDYADFTILLLLLVAMLSGKWQDFDNLWLFLKQRKWKYFCNLTHRIGILICWKPGNSSMTFLTPGQASIDFTYGFNLASIYQEAYRRHWHFQPSKWTALIASFADNPWIKLKKVLDLCHRNDNIDSKSKYLLSLINSSLCHF